MAREATITQEQVNEVAGRLRAAGVKPTARAVREELGSGSMATVLKHLQVWQAGQVRQAEVPVTLPPGLQRALVDFIGQEVAAAKLTLEADLVVAQQANVDLIAESERQATALDEAEQGLEGLRSARDALQGRIGQLTADLEASQVAGEAQRQAAENARTELAKQQLRLEGLPKLEAEVERLRVALDAERAGRVLAEQTAAVAAAKLEKTEGQVADLEKRLSRAEDEARAANQTATSLREQAQALQASFEVAVRDVNQARDDVKRAEAEASVLRGQMLELRTTA